MESDPSIVEILRDRAFSEDWLLWDDDDNPIDLTGCALGFPIRYKAGGEPLVTADVTIVDAAAGEIRIELTSDQVAQLAQRVLHWQLDFTDAAGALQTPGMGAVLMQDSN